MLRSCFLDRRALIPTTTTTSLLSKFKNSCCFSTATSTAAFVFDGGSDDSLSAQDPADCHNSTTIMLFGNRYLNLPWILATGLAVWFLFFHTPPFWKHRHLLQTDLILVVHICAASTIYLACVHNCLCTPGGGDHLQQHTWVGRVGMVSGIVSFVLGVWMSWTRLGQSTTVSFSLPITIGGLLQINAQYRGYVAIREYKEKKLAGDCSGPEQQALLRSHIGNMVSLFIMACGIPAALRLSEALAPNETLAVFGLVAIIVGFQSLASKYVGILSEPQI